MCYFAHAITCEIQHPCGCDDLCTSTIWTVLLLVGFAGACTVGATHECLQEREEPGARKVSRRHIAWKEQHSLTFVAGSLYHFYICIRVKGIVKIQIQFVENYVECKMFMRLRLKEMYRYTTCSPLDPLRWMGAIKIRAQTADKNITITHR